MKKSLLFVLVINSLTIHAQLTPKSVNTDKGVIGFYEFKPAGYNPDSTYNYPVLIFLHGVGERGNGTTDLPMALNSSFAYLIGHGATMKFVVNGRPHAFIVLLPQMSKDYFNWQDFYVDAMIDYAKKNLRIDTNKIFLSGWSLGGGGAWKYATSSVQHASRLAGIIPVAPAPDYTDLCNLALGKVAVWAHHARDDASVPLHYTEDAITAINACAPMLPAEITYYPHGGHPYVANWAYDTLNTLGYPNVYQWMIGTSRSNNLTNNRAPVAKAGNDTTLILPALSTVLHGNASFDPNDVIIHYAWTMISGPASPELKIYRPNFPSTNVSGLEPGNYTFRLTVSDEFGAVASDSINVHVVLPASGENARPVANAGPDLTIHDDNYFITGKARDFDGFVKSFQWRQISGPRTITITASGNAANLWGMSLEGTYGLELSAHDNHTPDGVGKDTVYITRDLSFPVYFSYLSKEKPFIKDSGIIRYVLLGMFMIVCCVPVLRSGKHHSDN